MMCSTRRTSDLVWLTNLIKQNVPPSSVIFYTWWKSTVFSTRRTVTTGWRYRKSANHKVPLYRDIGKCRWTLCRDSVYKHTQYINGLLISFSGSGFQYAVWVGSRFTVRNNILHSLQPRAAPGPPAEHPVAGRCFPKALESGESSPPAPRRHTGHHPAF